MLMPHVDTAQLEIELACHLGKTELLDQICRHALLPAGKLFRPRLLIDACLATGGDAWQALPAAAGTELGHVASLVHDDIIDNDEVRRGRPSAHVAFGTNNAIVAGDAMLFGLFLKLSQCAARGVPAERVVQALAAVSRAGIDLCRGQMLEEALVGNPGATMDTYLETVRGKTAAMFAGACEIGALLAGGIPEQVDALSTYGTELGITFQMADDLLAYSSNSVIAGKNLDSDLRNRRMTFPLLVAADLGGNRARKELAEIFANPFDELTIERARALIDETGTLARAETLIQTHVARALVALQLLLPSDARDRLTSYATAAFVRAA